VAITTKEVDEFLHDYADFLRGFELPDSDFPLKWSTEMSWGYVKIETSDGRHVAAISVQGAGQSPSCPVGGPDVAYAKLFVWLANTFYEFKKVVLKYGK
jgi:hypothetical protein